MKKSGFGKSLDRWLRSGDSVFGMAGHHLDFIAVWDLSVKLLNLGKTSDLLPGSY